MRCEIALELLPGSCAKIAALAKPGRCRRYLAIHLEGLQLTRTEQRRFRFFGFNGR
jgi:hypothetical protein